MEQRRRCVDKRRSTGRDVTLGAVERFSWGLRHRPTDSCPLPGVQAWRGR